MISARLHPTLAILLSLFLGAGLSATASADQEVPRLLTRDGDVQRLVTGPMDELFPATNRSVQVLALEIETAHGVVERHLVPGTDTWRPETPLRAFYEAGRDASIVVWASGPAGGARSLHFATFQGGEWSGVGAAQIGGRTHYFDEIPVIFDSFESLTIDTVAPEGGETETLHASRRILHLLWHDADTERVRYLVIPFDDGLYADWMEPSSLVLPEGTDDSAKGDRGAVFFDARPSADGLSLQVSLGNPERYGTIHVEVRPLSLQLLGDSVLERILAERPWLDPTDPASVARLGEIMRGHIVPIGRSFKANPATLEYVAGRLDEWLRDNGSGYAGDIDGLARDARMETIEIGASVYAKTSVDPANPNATILDLDLGDFLDSNGHRAELADLVRLELRADFTAPTVPGLAEAETTVHTSADGRSLLVAWHDAENATVRWIENRGDGWSEPRSLRLSESLDLAAAQALLHESIR